MASTSKSRLILFENGATLGVFPDEGIRGKHSPQGATTLVVEPSGNAFTHVQEDGSCLRQLSDYCKHALLPQLSVLTAFRNLHSGRPYLLTRFSRTGQDEIACATTTNTAPRQPHVESVPSVTNHPRSHQTPTGHPSHETPQHPRSRHPPKIIGKPPTDGTTLSGAHHHYGGETRSHEANVPARISPPSVKKKSGVSTNETRSRRRRNFPGEVSTIAVWPARADYKSGQYCAVGTDGSVEVRAVGGNARLTLSALRSLVEVDFATSSSSTMTTTDDTDCANNNSGNVSKRCNCKSEPQFDVRSKSRHDGLRNIRGKDRFSSMSPQTSPSAARVGTCFTMGDDVGMNSGTISGGAAERRATCRGGDSTYRRSAERRVWVTRQFLVCDVPPEFAHPLAVAFSVAVGHPAGHSVKGGGGDQGDSRAGDGRRRALESEVARGDGEGAHVLSKLPLPEEMPDHPRWDTVKGSCTQGVYYDEHRHLIGQLYPSETSRFSDADAEPPHLLAVDVLGISHGDGYAGTIAATVEIVHGCTYRIVHDHSVDRGGRHGGDGVNVHVVIHADGSEVLLEGEFIRILRPASRTNPRLRSRILHVSATSTVRLDIVGVASPPPPPLPPASTANATGRRTPNERNAGTPAGANTSAPTAARSHHTADSSGRDLSSPRAPALHSTVATGHRGGGISVGEITARAQAFRQQFVSWTTCRRSGENRTVPSGIPAATSCPRMGYGGGVGCARSIAGGVGSGRLRAGGRDAGAHVAFGGMEHVLMLGSAVERAMTTTMTADPQILFVPLLMPTACSCRNEALSEAITGNRHYHHHNCESYRSEPVPSTCKNLPDSTKVVERVERSGASFVLFADGRSRGVFADRTIVRLPAPSDCSLPDGAGKWSWPGTECARVSNAGGARVATVGVVGSGCNSCIGGRRLSERVGNDLVDCVLPDGTVLRLTRHCFSRRECHGNSDGNICSRAKALRPYVLAVRRFVEWAAAEPCERRARSEKSERAHRAAAVEAEKNRRFVTLRRLQQQRSSSSAVPHSSAKYHLAKNDITCAFVDGESSTPARRDRRHERTPLGTRITNVPPPVVVTPDAKSMDTLKHETPEDLQGAQAILRQERRVKFMGYPNDTSSNSSRSGRDGCASRGPENDYHGDNDVSGSCRGMVGNVEPTNVGIRERNEIVRRLLEANREILLSPVVSCRVDMLRPMR